MKECPASVRSATTADEAQLYALLQAMYADLEIAHGIPISPTRLMDQIKVATERGLGVIGIVDGEHGTAAASVGVFLSRWWWSEVPFHQLLWTFIRPEYRGKVDPADLFRFSQWAEAHTRESLAARGLDIKFLTEATHSAGVRLKARDRLWGRFGKRVGSVFLLNGA